MILNDIILKNVVVFTFLGIFCIFAFMEKKLIYYFSATGNSLALAKEYAKNLNAELCNITSVLNNLSNDQKIETDANVVGLISPVYFFGLPKIVCTFLEKLVIKSKNPYVFAVVTYGGFKGGALNQIAGYLLKNNVKLNYGGAVNTVGTYIKMYDIDSEKIDEKLVKANLKAEKLLTEIKAQKHKIVSPKIDFVSKFMYEKYLKECENNARNFVVDNSCIGCGLCSKLCPTQNIKAAAGAQVFSPCEAENETAERAVTFFRPGFSNKCQQCFACVHWCPKQSIQYTESTRGRKRYHNPKVSVEEIKWS